MGASQCSCRCTDELAASGMLRPIILELPAGDLCSGELDDEDEACGKVDGQPSLSSFSTAASTTEGSARGTSASKAGRFASQPPPPKVLPSPASTSSRHIGQPGCQSAAAVPAAVGSLRSQAGRTQYGDGRRAEWDSLGRREMEQRKKVAAEKAAAAVQAVATAMQAAEVAIEEAAQEEAAAVAAAESRFVPIAQVHRHVEISEKRGPPLPAQGRVSLDRRANARRG
eukprot:TRINITY_DN22854_c0_g1_i1.p1 TRINITY_DN22854_c0_g1~~TRINITY_DN22854_c0_g1_i1.p1  ORF type:complete len:236 (+),score=37.69 TRINITY_DN22854_c0_g1_i1:28-708(+)